MDYKNDKITNKQREKTTKVYFLENNKDEEFSPRKEKHQSCVKILFMNMNLMR